MPRSSLPRRAATIAACLGVTAAVGAAPAMATPVQSTQVYANGSSLQKISQIGGTNAAGFVWLGWAAIWHSTAGDRSTLNCTPQGVIDPSPCTSTYTSGSSGTGLAEFGDEAGTPIACTGAAAGSLDLACDATADSSSNAYGKPVLDGWVGSDDPPSTTDLSNAATAAGGTVNQVTVPVAQAPVAILLSVPTDITLGTSTSTVKLKNTVLQSIYNPPASGVGTNVPGSTHCPGGVSGSVGSWCALFEDSGYTLITSGTPTATKFLITDGTDGGPIEDMVRSSPSGTTYSQKGFLDVSGDANYPSSFVNDNEQWPTNLNIQDCTGAGSCLFSGGNPGGSNLVKNTIGDPGSIGYANLADAAEASASNGSSCPTTPIFGFKKSPQTVNCVSGTSVAAHQILYVYLQNNYNPTCTTGCPAATYALPEGAEGVANVYTGADTNVNGSGGVGTWTVPLSGSTEIPTGSWAGTIASDPNIVGDSSPVSHAYPDVAVTYDLAWTTYDDPTSNLTGASGYLTPGQGAAVGSSVLSYLTYETKSSTGQANLTSGKQYYAKLPTSIDGYAVQAVSGITP